MTSKQKEYIEKHIDLIENDEWDRFFATNSDQFEMSFGLGAVIYRAGIDFLNHMKEVPGCCFANSESISEIDIPSNINAINYKSFYNCRNLKSVTIPDNVTDIGPSAFALCTSLTNINMPKKLEYIDTFGLSGCAMKSIVLPDRMQIINDNAFYACTELINIEIPDSVEHIGVDVFDKCDQLTINYKGTMSKWKSICKHTKDAFKNSVKAINCIDGTI